MEKVFLIFEVGENGVERINEPLFDAWSTRELAEKEIERLEKESLGRSQFRTVPVVIRTGPAIDEKITRRPDFGGKRE